MTRFRPGDDVYGVCDGAFADYATARVETLAAKPASLTFEQAAALPTSGCTALQALRDTGEIAAGERVLIIGASGGVGLFAVQIAKALGAEVTGVCSTAKMDLVRSVGADHVIDYTAEEVTDSGQRYDLVLDTGGDRTLAALRRCLTPARQAGPRRRRGRRPDHRRGDGPLAAGGRLVTVHQAEPPDGPGDHQGGRSADTHRSGRERQDPPGDRPGLSAQ